MTNAMTTRLAAAAVAALALPACLQDRDRPDAAPAGTSGGAEAPSADARDPRSPDDPREDFPVEVWGDLPASSARDSAGIRIVENASPAEGSRLHWAIGLEPDVSIGDIDGEDPYLLSYAWDATKLADGRIVVVDRSTSELRVFDAAGVYLTKWGGQGEGPGEFPPMSLGHVEPWPGDSIVAWYSDAQTISVFDGEGNFGRSFNRPGAGQRPWEVARPELVRRNGSILAVLERGENGGIAEVRILDGEGGLHVSLGDHRSRRALYFSRELRLGLWGDLAVVAPNDRYELMAFADDGALVRIVRREHVPRVPRAEDIMVSPTLRPEWRIPMEAEMRRVPQSQLEETFPAFAEIMSDAAGYLWVREFEPPKEAGPAPVWTVFSPEGRVLGFVETPPGLEIYEIGEDYLLGHAKGELDVEMIQVWALAR